MRLTARTVEIFHNGERIAAHQRMSRNHKHTTVPEHMASSHRRYAGWTIERIRWDAAAIGPATLALCNLILDERPHPEQASAPVSASSGSPDPVAANGSKRPRRERSTSARAPKRHVHSAQKAQALRTCCALVRRRADSRVLKLIQQMLEAGYEERGQKFATPRGTPQGGVVSSTMNRANWQREEPEAQRKAAAFNRWHEPDESRGSSPDL